MLEPEDYILPLDNLFFERPVIQKVKPLCQEQGIWELEPPPSVSQIPATQELQKELQTLCSFSSTQRANRFILPVKKTGVNNYGFAEACDLQHATDPDRSLGKEESGLYPSEGKFKSQSLFNGDRIAQMNALQLHDAQQLLDERTLHTGYNNNNGGSSQFRKSLFKSPQTTLVSKSHNHYTSMQGLKEGAQGDRFHARFSEVTADPFMTSGDNAQGPTRGPALFGACDSSTSKHDQNTRTAHVLPLTPLPLTVRGGLGVESGTLRPVTEIPAQFRSVFKEFPYFNYIQSKALEDLLYTSKNVVAGAPTGSGKTVLFELAIIRLLMQVPAPWSNIKVVYMAPIKALCSQRYENWKQKFGPLGLICKELTGDTEMDDFFEIQDAHLIMTTPEKWDSMTRKWSDNCLVQLVRLFLIDEVHVVKDACRGATLEVVVSRMKTNHSSHSRGKQNPESHNAMRFVAVSATIPNIADIADWLSDGTDSATCLEMDESHRPVKLRKVVLGFPCSSNQTEFKFDLSLNYKMANVIQTYSDQKPTLVFCATRKGVQQSASVLAKDARFIVSIEHKQRLLKYANSILDSKLRDLVMYGIGFHHAGIDTSDRKIIENAFTLGDLPVLFTTSTLAMGVNLPAHLVVIKSTMHYIGGMFQEYSDTDILQMIGRAGRPQFDTTATAVIMTRFQTKDRYTQLVSGAETIESSLHKHLIEHLNAEIVLHTISDVNVALDWIRSTFLYIRALKNPSHYGFPPGLDRAGIEAKLQELCLKNLNALASIGLIAMDEDINFKPTETGKLMARYCIAYDTMTQFSTVSGTETLSELIILISKGKEFSDVQLRVNEKRTLNTLNRDKNRQTIRYPIDGKIKNNEMKVNCLIQAQFGCIPVQEFGLTQDTGKIFRNGTRVTKCLSEFLIQHAKTNFTALLNSLILAKCFRAKLWENSQFVSKQLEKIGLTLSTAMVNAGLTSFHRIEQSNARELELIVNRHPPFGNQIKEAVIHLPKYEVSLEQIPRYSVTTAEVIVTVNLTNYELLMLRRTAPDNHYVTLLIGNSDNHVVFQQKLTDSLLLRSGSWSKKIEVTRALKGEELSVNLISSEYVGLDIVHKYSAWYSGPKRFGTHMSSRENLQTDSVPASQQGAPAPSTVPTSHQGPSKEIYSSNPDQKRQCNHYCKNKELCGHDCCKVGVSVALKSAKHPESSFSSYLRDLKCRNEALAETPVKRLKIKMCNDFGAADHHQFSYKQKDVMPDLARHERDQHGRAMRVGTFDPPDVYETLQQKAELQYGGQGFSVWKQPHIPPKNITTVIPNKSARYSDEHSFDADDSGCFSSDALNVTFDLGVDDWDDFDDDNLVHASELSVQERPAGSSASHVKDAQLESPFTEYNRSGFHGKTYIRPPLAQFAPPRTQTSDSQTSNFRSFSDEGTKPHAEMTGNRVLPSYAKHSNVSSSALCGKFDFFTQPNTATTALEIKGRYHGEESSTEVSAFLGIFDGIF